MICMDILMLVARLDRHILKYRYADYRVLVCSRNVSCMGILDNIIIVILLAI